MTDLRALEAERLAELRDWLGQRARSQQTALGWSGVGSDCERQTWNTLHGVPKVNDQQRVLASMRGIAVHEFLAPFFAERGWQIETEVEFAGIPGSVDLLRDGVVEDIKTGSADKVRALRTYGPDRSWRWQVQGYARSLVEKGYDVHTVRIVAYAYDSSEEVGAWEEPYDPSVSDEALAHVADLAGRDEPPAPGKDASFCKDWCSFYDEFMDKGGCPSRTLGANLVELEDTVLRSAASDLRTARDDVKAATERKKAAEAVLSGVTGLVDGYAVTQVTVQPSEVPDDEAIREAYGFIVGDLPMKERNGYSYVSIRKARKSDAA
jgi:hypothetical protein